MANVNRRYATKNRHFQFAFFTNCSEAVSKQLLRVYPRVLLTWRATGEPEGQVTGSADPDSWISKIPRLLAESILERNGKSLAELSIMNIQNPTLAHFRHFSSLYTNLRSTTVENIRQITPFYAKQTQFQKWNNEHKYFLSNEIRNFRHFDGWKNKAKTNPIKAKTNPIQTQ